MSDLLWPIENDFPQNILLDNTETLNSNTIADEMESGLPHRRRRDTVNFSTWKAQVYLRTDAQRDTMKRFWQIDSKNGSIPFIWTDPITGTEKTYIMASFDPIIGVGAGRHYASFTLQEVPE